MSIFNARSGVCLAGLLLGAAAVADPPAPGPPAADVRACAAIEAQHERLACYDSVVRSENRDEPTQAVPVLERDAESSKGSVPRADAAPDAADAERAQKERDQDEAFWITVVSVRHNLSGMSVFTTEGGDVFAQTSTEHMRYGDVPFRARLVPGSFGTYFLRAESGGRSVRVSRKR
jgi:hypothetical protein